MCQSVNSPGCGSKLDLTKLNTTNTTYIVAINSTQRCTKHKLSNIYVRAYSDATACPNGGNHCNSSKIGHLTVGDCCCNTDLCNGVLSIQHQYSILISTISVLIVIKNIFTV
ncbi:unnamed protein product [Adineta steineri]|uniref:Uncharacterized protein n=2 Tax=Adineta steineri TaxID=433720 RepID=A0A814W9X3_9BILA|nr:unnamed protein product [Adineta steineri]